MNEIIKNIEAAQLKENVPSFNVGDTVKVYNKIKEGNRERIQIFEGTVIKRQNGGARETFTVRKNSNGIAVASAASAALGAISEDPSALGKSLIFVGLAEGVCLYGLIISFMIIGKLG